MEKTNVYRLFDQKKIKYQPHGLDNAEGLSGAEMAKALGQAPEQVFKTLVTVGKSKKNYVFMIPVEEELDLKKAAKAVGEKSIEMIKAKELLPLTGYVHGGCSPVGMKKVFPTFVDRTAEHMDTIMFSAGKIGYQVEANVMALSKFIKFDFADLTQSEKSHTSKL